MLDTNFVAADDHMVVLAVADALSALRQHREILVAHRGVNSVEDRVVTGARLVVWSAGTRASQLCRTVHRVGDPAGRISITSTPTELLARIRFG